MSAKVQSFEPILFIITFRSQVDPTNYHFVLTAVLGFGLF